MRSGRSKSAGGVLISACLAGLCCRFDGSQRLRKSLLESIKGGLMIPICPEQLGGLSTPRGRAEIISGNGFDVLRGRAKVVNSAGLDITLQFLKGAKETLKIARLNKIQIAYLKEKSPSCGTAKIISRKKVKSGPGVTAAFLIKQGIEVIGVD